MFSIAREAVPEDALLKTYRGDVRPERWGRYDDCFSVTVDRVTDLSEFVFAFYTSPVFRLERLILRVLAGAPSTDSQARVLAEGSGTSFAVWRVGRRTATQLLMCDRYERTRSWFRVVALKDGKTLMQFGSAVASGNEKQSQAEALGRRFRLLLRFHALYSQVLLHAAKIRVMRLSEDG